MKLADRSAMARLFADEQSAEWHTAIWSGFQSIYSDIDQWEITITSQVDTLSLLRALSLRSRQHRLISSFTGAPDKDRRLVSPSHSPPTASAVPVHQSTNTSLRLSTNDHNTIPACIVGACGRAR